MKKAYLFFALAFVVVAFSACKEEKMINAPITSIRFEYIPEEGADGGVFVGINNTKATAIIMEPTTANWPQVIYSSADTTIVKIGADGLLTGVGKGVTNVYAQIESGLKATLKVYVDAISVTKIDIKVAAKSFDEYDVEGVLKNINGQDSTDTSNKKVEGKLVNLDTLFLNDMAIMQVAIEPIEASFAQMEWTTSDPAIFEIKGDTIIAKHVGTARIEGRLKENHPADLKDLVVDWGDFSTVDTVAGKLTVEWTVKEAELQKIEWQIIGSHKMYVDTNEDVMSLISFTPSYASDKTLEFESTDPNVFGVANGRVYCYSYSDSIVEMTVRSPKYWNDRKPDLMSIGKFSVRK